MKTTNWFEWDDQWPYISHSLVAFCFLSLQWKKKQMRKNKIFITVIIQHCMLAPIVPCHSQVLKIWSRWTNECAIFHFECNKNKIYIHSFSYHLVFMSILPFFSSLHFVPFFQFVRIFSYRSYQNSHSQKEWNHFWAPNPFIFALHR